MTQAAAWLSRQWLMLVDASRPVAIRITCCMDQTIKHSTTMHALACSLHLVLSRHCILFEKPTIHFLGE